MRSLLLIVVCMFSMTAGATGNYHDNDDGDVINNTTNNTYNTYIKKGDKRADYIIGTAVAIWAGCSAIKLYQEGSVCNPFAWAKKETPKDDDPLQLTPDNVSDKPANKYIIEGR